MFEMIPGDGDSDEMDPAEIKLRPKGGTGEISLSQLNQSPSRKPKKQRQVEENCETSSQSGSVSQGLVNGDDFRAGRCLFSGTAGTERSAWEDSNHALSVVRNPNQTACIDEINLNCGADLNGLCTPHEDTRLNDQLSCKLSVNTLESTERRNVLELNLDVKAECDAIAQDKDSSCHGMESPNGERCMDLNIEFDCENRNNRGDCDKRSKENIPNGGIGIISNNGLTGINSVQQSKYSEVTADRCLSGTDLGSQDAVGASCGEGSRIWKKRKLPEYSKSTTKMVLRRSTRRGSALMSIENHDSRGISSHVEMNSSLAPTVVGVAKEDISSVGCEELLGHSETPPKVPLPPSSQNLSLDGVSVFDVFFVYAFLRSFSTLLFLSPFELEDFVVALKCEYPTSLFDSIHVSLLKILRKHLEFLSNEGTQSAIDCLRDLNWCLLDLITWPFFMTEYLLFHNSGLKRGLDLNYLKLLDGDYYNQPAFVKVEVLHCLCDDVLEAEVVLSELNRRSWSSDPDLVSERNLNNENFTRKKVGADVSGGTCLMEGEADEASDWNSDECCLCKMDGSLICCDGCPAAYHSKCVGVANDLLPKGDWYCSECVISKNTRVNLRESLRGAEVLGVDPHGRLYFSCCCYLLVSDPCNGESSFNYYQSCDVNGVIEVLKSSDIRYSEVLSAVSKHWNIPMGAVPCKALCSGESSIITVASGTAQDNKIKDVYPGTVSSCGNADKMDALSHLKSAIDYVNCYIFAQVASSVAKELICKSSEKNNKDSAWAAEDIISAQLKMILNKCTKFCCPSLLNDNVLKENCGWCFPCRTPTDGSMCLFKMFRLNPVLKCSKSDVADIKLKRARKGHLVDVCCHIMSIEDRLHGLLLGPWLNPLYSNIWHQALLNAPDVKSVKSLLLTLELNLHRRAVQDDWLKYTDSANVIGSALHVVTRSLHISSKHGISRKRARVSDFESNASSSAVSGLGLYWWRGGRISRRLFAWKVLPRSLVLIAARQAGCRKIPGILYPDNSDFAKRSKFVAWRATVETAISVEQLAIQVRDFDSNIRWDDIENSHPLPMMYKDSKKSVRSFKKVIIWRKSIVGSVVKYLLDFGKRRFIPEIVLKYGSLVDEKSTDRRKYWLDEAHVPLHLLKSFEDNRISRKSTKISGKICGSARKKNPSKRDVFSYLFLKAQRSESYQCGHCYKNVPISEALSCQHCNGFFHKRHVRRSLGAVDSEHLYTCLKCWDAKHVIIGGRRQRVPSRKYKAVSTESKSVQLKSAKRTSRSGRVVKAVKNKEISASVPLRRSTRKVKVKYIPQGTINSGGSKRGKQFNCKKRTHRKPKKFASWKRKRTQLFHTYWLNGLLLSEKPNDERVSDFKRRQLTMPSKHATDIGSQRKCCLCCEAGDASTLDLIACDFCGDWFHGDAFGLNIEKRYKIIKFNCHACRKRSPPVCHNLSVSVMDKSFKMKTNGGNNCTEEVPNASEISLNHKSCPDEKPKGMAADSIGFPVVEENSVESDDECILVVEAEKQVCKSDFDVVGSELFSFGPCEENNDLKVAAELDPQT